MKKLLILAVTAFFSLFSAANAQDQNPYEIANSVASTSLAKIKAAKGDKSALEKIIEEDLLPFIDVKYAAYKVMGTCAKTLSKEDRERFTDAFTVYMKKSFVDALGKYTNQEIIPSPVKEVKADEGLVAVKLMIHEEGKKDLEMVLKMRKNSKTGEWKAFDLVGENISILDAKTSEIFPVLSSKGVNAAIEVLNGVKK